MNILKKYSHLLEYSIKNPNYCYDLMLTSYMAKTRNILSAAVPKPKITNFSQCFHTSTTTTNQDYSSSAADSSSLIYYGSLTPKIKAVKVFSLTTSVTGLLAQPLLIEQGGKIGGAPMIVLMCGFVGFFTFVTPFLIHFITKKYVTEIHYDKLTDEYQAIIITFFLRKHKITFKVDDVHVPEIAGMFSTFNVGKKSLFVDPALFNDTKHYVKLMGYDKPIDFKLNETDGTTDVDKSDLKQKNQMK